MDDYMLTRDISFSDDQTTSETLRDMALSMRLHLMTLSPDGVDIRLSPRSAKELSDFILTHTAPTLPANGVRVPTESRWDIDLADPGPRRAWLAFAVAIPVAMLATYGAIALILRVLA